LYNKDVIPCRFDFSRPGRRPIVTIYQNAITKFKRRFQFFTSFEQDFVDSFNLVLLRRFDALYCLITYLFQIYDLFRDAYSQLIFKTSFLYVVESVVFEDTSYTNHSNIKTDIAQNNIPYNILYNISYNIPCNIPYNSLRNIPYNIPYQKVKIIILVTWDW
jgi:hypothetical protein